MATVLDSSGSSSDSSNIVAKPDFISVSLNNNLTSLLEVTPADPVIYLKLEEISDDNEEYDKQESASDWSLPTKNKNHLSRIEKFKSKVKTVAQIRKKYEVCVTAEILSSLKNTEQEILKIVKRKDKFSQSELDSLINTRNPMTRAAWVLSTLSKHKKQYLCDGSSIYRLSGCNSEYNRMYTFKEGAVKNKISLISNQENIDKCRTLLPKRCLLKQSLDLSFNPGPRSKKPFLDVSHQRYSIGKSKLVNMPSAGIELSTGSGSQLDHSDKYAEYAASAYYTKRNKIEAHVIPILYDNNRNNLLVRQDCEMSLDFNDKSYPNSNVENELAGLDADLEYLNNYNPLDAIESDIKSVINDMLKSVSISLLQDHIGKHESDNKDIIKKKLDMIVDRNKKNTITEKKTRRKRNNGFYEFRNLGMTMINVDENGGNHTCIPQCQLGCIDLNAKCFVNVHCRHVDCMFEDHCLFTGMRQSENIELPLQAKNLQLQATKNLTKEELKFHQTVILSNNETIVMEANERDIRNKRLADTDLVKIPAKKKRLTVVLQRLPELHSVEVWCMIHQLYRCFCQGRYLEGNPFKLSVNNLKSEEIYYPMINKTPLSNSSEINNAKLDTDHKTKETPIISQGSKFKNNTFKNIHKVRRNIKKKIQQQERVDKPVKICPLETNLIIEETDNTIKDMTIDNSMIMRRKRLSRKSAKHSETDKSLKVDPSVSTSNLSTDQGNILRNNKTSNVNKSRSPNSSVVNEIIIEKKHSSPMSQPEKDIWIASSLKGKQTMNRGQSAYLYWLKQQIQKAVQLRRDRADFSQLLYDKTKKIVCPWNDLLNMYIKKKFSFYISKNQPWKFYFSENQVPVDNCIEVRSLPLNALDEYPPFVKKILFKLMNCHSFVIISPKPDSPIWEIIGKINKKNPDIHSENGDAESRNSVEENSKNIDGSSQSIPNNGGSILEDNSFNDNAKEDILNESCKGKEDVSARKKSPKEKKKPLAINKKVKGGDGAPMKNESFKGKEDIIIPSTKGSLEGREDSPVVNKNVKSEEDVFVKNKSFEVKSSLVKIGFVDEVNEGLVTLKEEIKENYKTSLLITEGIEKAQISENQPRANDRNSLANTISRLRNKLMLSHSVSTGDKLKPNPVIKNIPERVMNAFQYPLPTNFENLKWLQMPIENDFAEIHIPSKGFSITYEFIDCAINSAETNNKTVTFLDHSANQNGNNPAFGIYVFPKVDRRCIFIGPYKPYEEAGVRVVTKDGKELGEQRTPGIWLSPPRIDVPQEKKCTEENSAPAIKTSRSENKNAESNSGNFISFDSIAVNVPVASTSNPVVAETRSSFPFTNIVKLNEAKGNLSKLPKIIIKRNALLANQGKLSLRKLPRPQITAKKMVKLFPGGTSILKPVSKDMQINTNSVNSEENQMDNQEKRSESDQSGDIAAIFGTEIPLADQGEKPNKNKEEVKSHDSNNVKETILTCDNNDQATILTDKSSDNSNYIQGHAPEEKGTVLALDDIKQTSESVEPNNKVNNAVEVAYEHKDGDTPAENPVYIMPDRFKDLGYIIGTRKKDSKDIQFSFPGSKEINIIHEQSLNKDLNRLTSARITFVPRELDLKWMIIDSLECMTSWSPMKEEHVDGSHVLTNSGFQKTNLQKKCDGIKTAFNTIQSLERFPNRKTRPNKDKWALVHRGEKLFIQKLQKKDQDATKDKVHQRVSFT